jgi:hypothetical protein
MTTASRQGETAVIHPPIRQTRRAALATGLAASAAPAFATAATAPSGAQDMAFFVGSWSVRHRRLRTQAAGGKAWEDFGGTCVNWPTLGGAGSADENLFEAPGGAWRGTGVQAFDDKTGLWSSWWIDGRTATLDPPVRGRFRDGVGTFFGDDTVDGRPVKVRVQWSRITPRSVHWEQAFSTDQGTTWKTNWISDFTRLAQAPGDPSTSGDRHDFDFVRGRFNVRHHRLRERLAGSTEWEDFAGTSELWTTLGSHGTVDDNWLALPAGAYRAMGVRAFNEKTRQWAIWWLDARSPNVDPPVLGGFKDGVGTFIGDDMLRGKPVKVRFQWSRITATSAHWEQAFSPDGGSTWETNWTMEFARA